MQAGRLALPFPPEKEATYPRQAVRQVLIRQLLTFLPGKEAIHPQQAVRQALSFPPGKAAILPRQLLTFLPEKEAIHPQQAGTLLPSGEGSNSSQAIAHLPPR